MAENQATAGTSLADRLPTSIAALLDTVQKYSEACEEVQRLGAVEARSRAEVRAAQATIDKQLCEQLLRLKQAMARQRSEPIDEQSTQSRQAPEQQQQQAEMAWQLVQSKLNALGLNEESGGEANTDHQQPSLDDDRAQ